MTNAVSIAQSGSNNQTMRNRIINGAMMINQRALGVVSPVTSDGLKYTVDRWWAYNGNASSKFSIQQSSDAPSGFSYSLLATSLSAYSVGAGEEFDVGQLIEGFNFADMAWGTANAQPVTLSFWIKSSLTGTFGGSLMNTAYNRSYPFTYTISAANTWEYKTITVPGDTSGTWIGATNGISLRVIFGLGVGSTKSGTAGAWASAEYESSTGAVSVVGTSGATWYITGVQLEEGTAASPFENRLYGTELALCQRYFTRFLGNAVFEQVPTLYIPGYNSTSGYACIGTQVPMRASPSISQSNIRLTDFNTTFAITSIASSGSQYGGPNGVECAFNVASGITQYRTYIVQANNSTSAQLSLSAEL
jgi:hypothetical protein